MTPQFFQNQLKILMEDFGPDEYTKNKTQMIWEFCHELPEKNFAFVIRHFIETRSVKYPPLPTHFREAALEQKKILRGESIHSKIEETGTIEQAGEALQGYLSKIGAGRILEAIEKNKVGKDTNFPLKK